MCFDDEHTLITPGASRVDVSDGRGILIFSLKPASQGFGRFISVFMVCENFSPEGINLTNFIFYF